MEEIADSENGRVLVNILGDIYEVGKPVATYMQMQEDTINQLRRSHEKQEQYFLKAVALLKDGYLAIKGGRP